MANLCPPIKLAGPRQRGFARTVLEDAPDGTVVTFKEPTRNLDQNALMWVLLADVADAQPEGRAWTPETWKAAFMHARGHEVRFEQALDGRGMFPIPYKSSQLSVREMADLITTIQEYGDRHGVRWSERKWA